VSSSGGGQHAEAHKQLVIVGGTSWRRCRSSIWCKWGASRPGWRNVKRCRYGSCHGHCVVNCMGSWVLVLQGLEQAAGEGGFQEGRLLCKVVVSTWETWEQG
jgi:hypothetical protein